MNQKKMSMNLRKIQQPFLVPSSVVMVICLIKYRCKMTAGHLAIGGDFSIGCSHE